MEVLQLYTGVCSLEMPIDTLLNSITLRIPGQKLLIKIFNTAYAPFGQTLVSQSGEFNFRNIQPTTMFGRMVYFKTFRQPEGFLRFECLIKGCDIMSIKVVTHKNNTLEVRIPLVE